MANQIYFIFVLIIFKFLDTLLIPTNPLARDVRTLADILGFSNTDISYIVHKPYPFLYMYDQWIKRHQQSAKLSTLYKALTEIMRKDAAEIVQNAIKGLCQHLVFFYCI